LIRVFREDFYLDSSGFVWHARKEAVLKDSSAEGGDLRDRSSTKEKKRQRKIVGGPANWAGMGNASGGGIGPANVAGYANSWQWMQPLWM
jgi:hypothetical protein